MPVRLWLQRQIDKIIFFCPICLVRIKVRVLLDLVPNCCAINFNSVVGSAFGSVLGGLIPLIRRHLNWRTYIFNNFLTWLCSAAITTLVSRSLFFLDLWCMYLILWLNTFSDVWLIPFKSFIEAGYYLN